jgi:hypothetical protein
MAAQAEENPADFRTADGEAEGQNFNETAIVTECDRFAVERAGVLSPQSIIAGVRGAAVTGTEEEPL